MRLRRLAPVGGVIVVLLGLSSSVAAQTPSHGHPPRALTDAGERGEDLYDAATAGHWTTARRLLASLKADAARLDSLGDSVPGARRRLDDEIGVLDTAVARRRRQATMAAANQVTLTVADMTEPFAPAIPVAITRLDYYGRELMIWSALAPDRRLAAAARGTRAAWADVRPRIAARDAALADRFERLVTQVEQARTPGDYRRVAQHVLDEVDNLEQAMAKPAR